MAGGEKGSCCCCGAGREKARVERERRRVVVVVVVCIVDECTATSGTVRARERVVAPLTRLLSPPPAQFRSGTSRSTTMNARPRLFISSSHLVHQPCSDGYVPNSNSTPFLQSTTNSLPLSARATSTNKQLFHLTLDAILISCCLAGIKVNRPFPPLPFPYRLSLTTQAFFVINSVQQVSLPPWQESVPKIFVNC